MERRCLRTRALVGSGDESYSTPWHPNHQTLKNMYTPQVLHAYKSSKSTLPITTWVQVVGRNLPQFRSDADIFNPIPIQIKLADRSDGNVVVSVSPADPKWYETLVEALNKMIGGSGTSAGGASATSATRGRGVAQRVGGDSNVRAEGANIRITDYLGQPISGLSPARLAAVGECDVIDVATNQPIRLKSIVPPPLELSTNKTAQLKTWWTENRNSLAQKIAGELSGLTMSELAKVTSLDGPIQKAVERHLEHSTLHGMSWSDFTRTFGTESTVDGPAKIVLDAIRQSLKANEKTIRDFHATVEGSESLWSASAPVSTPYKEDLAMYRDIVEDAVHHSLVGSRMIQAVTYGVGKKASSKKVLSKKQNRPSGVNPVANYYNQYHYKVHGKLPGHIMSQYNAKSEQSKDYPGDPDRVMAAFHLFTGRSVIGCGVCGGKKKKEKQQQRQQVEGALPPLVPIGTPIVAAASQQRQQPMPRLIPLVASAAEPPPLAPIGSSMPRLIPIDGPVAIPTNERLNKSVWETTGELNLEDFL